MRAGAPRRRSGRGRSGRWGRRGRRPGARGSRRTPGRPRAPSPPPAGAAPPPPRAPCVPGSPRPRPNRRTPLESPAAAAARRIDGIGPDSAALCRNGPLGEPAGVDSRCVAAAASVFTSEKMRYFFHSSPRVFVSFFFLGSVFVLAAFGLRRYGTENCKALGIVARSPTSTRI